MLTRLDRGFNRPPLLVMFHVKQISSVVHRSLALAIVIQTDRFSGAGVRKSKERRASALSLINKSRYGDRQDMTPVPRMGSTCAAKDGNPRLFAEGCAPLGFDARRGPVPKGLRQGRQTLAWLGQESSGLPGMRSRDFLGRVMAEACGPLWAPDRYATPENRSGPKLWFLAKLVSRETRPLKPRRRQLEVTGLLWGGCFRVRRGWALE